MARIGARIAPPLVLRLPGSKFKEEYDHISGDPRFIVDWSNLDNGGKKLEHACDVIYRHLDYQPQTYKIGVTHCPHHRFYKKYSRGGNAAISYAQEFRSMLLIAVHTEPGAIGILEAAAIREFKNIRMVPGILSLKAHNIRLRGPQAPCGHGPYSPCFLYKFIGPRSYGV